MDELGVALTDDAKWSLLQDITGEDFRHDGELFLPSETFYNALTPEDATTSAKQLFSWLAYKPHRLKVVMTDTPGTAAHTIYLPAHAADFPYITGRVLCLKVLAYYFTARKVNVSDDFIEYASVKLGFGLVILNGLTHPKNHAYLHHLLRGHWHLADKQPLNSYNTTEYAKAFEAYLHTSRISPKTWADYAGPLTLSTMQGLEQFRNTPIQPNVEAAHHVAAKHRFIKFGLATSAAALLFCLGLFVIGQRPYAPSAHVVDTYQTIQLLHQSYELCQTKARQQMNSSNQEDMFADRALEATLSRCQSLRNQYNYQVDQYNKLVAE